jgi:hypothetical protein
VTPETTTRAPAPTPAALCPPPGSARGGCAACRSGRAIESPVAGAYGARAAARECPFGSRRGSLPRPVSPGVPCAVAAAHPAHVAGIAGGVPVAMGLSGVAVRARTWCGRQKRAGHEIRQQAACASRFGRFRLTPVAGRAGGKRPLLEHPPREKRQRRFFHHFVEQNGQLPPEIGHVFQFGHLEVAKGSIRAFTKILHRRSAGPSHKVSPVGVGCDAAQATSRKGNTFEGLCKSCFAGENQKRLDSTPGTGFHARRSVSVIAHVQRL